MSEFWTRRSTVGIVLALVAYQQSLTPSLLPRSWVWQGVISGVSVLVVYLLGCLPGRLLRATGVLGPLHRDRLVKVRRVTGWVGVAAVPVLLLLSLPGRQAEWQTLGYDDTDRFLYAGVVVVVLGVLVAGALLTWGCRLVYGRIFWGVSRLVPWSVGGGVSVVLTALVVTLAVNEVAYSRFMDGINATRESADADVGDDEPAAPTSPLLSGGEDSALSWWSLGREGRRFIARAPDPAALERYAGTDVADPVRVFVGRASADSYTARADLAVRELERTGGFDREVLLLVTPTGTGWVNEQIVQPVEYFHAGDTATVAMQYSHLPSPVAYLSEQTAAVESAAALLTAVSSRLESMPRERRPQLLVAGESLGSYGGTGAFANLDDMVRRTDGAVWVGTPPMSDLRREAERRREPGSLEIRPTVATLPEVVFAGRDTELSGTPGTHAFLQYADDPIVWWEPSLAWSRPDWLEEPLDPRVKSTLSWRPVTTFLQVSADQAVGTAFGEGLGHRYGTLPLVAWHETLDPPGWDAARLDALREHLDALADGFH